MKICSIESDKRINCNHRSWEDFHHNKYNYIYIFLIFREKTNIEGNIETIEN
jgi:hypothetical protein